MYIHCRSSDREGKLIYRPEVWGTDSSPRAPSVVPSALGKGKGKGKGKGRVHSCKIYCMKLYKMKVQMEATL